MTSLLRRDLEGGILRLTLDDPATRNSLSEAMMAALQEALDSLQVAVEESGAGALVLCGNTRGLPVVAVVGGSPGG